MFSSKQRTPSSSSNSILEVFKLAKTFNSRVLKPHISRKFLISPCGKMPLSSKSAYSLQVIL